MLGFVVWIGGSLLLLGLFAWTQTRFYAAHRARYGTWRTAQEWWFEEGKIVPREYWSTGFRMVFRRVDDPRVERLRRLHLVTWVAPLAWFVGFPVVALLAARLVG